MNINDSRPSAATVADVYAARTDEGVRSEACRQSGALDWTVAITSQGSQTRVQVDRAMPPMVPDFVRRFVGDRINVRQVEQWGEPDAAGARTAQVLVTIQGQPAKMDGVRRLTPAAQGSIESVDGDVKVNVPFFGARIEPEIAKVILAALEVEHRTGEEWLASNRDRGHHHVHPDQMP